LLDWRIQLRCIDLFLFAGVSTLAILIETRHGAYSEMNEMTGLKVFMPGLAARIAMEAVI